MSDQWPPPAPDINKDFKNSHDAKNDNVPQSQNIVTKKEIADLEKQRKKPVPELVFKPPGVKPNPKIEQERNERIEKMKKRLQKREGQAREDFNRSR